MCRVGSFHETFLPRCVRGPAFGGPFCRSSAEPKKKALDRGGLVCPFDQILRTTELRRKKKTHLIKAAPFESKGSIDPWIHGLTAPTVTMSPWIQESMAHFTIYAYRCRGPPPLQSDCKMRHRPLNPRAHCHSWSSEPVDPGVYGTLGFSYQFVHMLTN